MSFRWRGQSEDGSTVTLRRFEGDFQIPGWATEDWLKDNWESIRSGVVVDLETTGLDHRTDQVIEIGMRPFLFHRASGDVVRVDERFDGLQDPGQPLSQEIQRLTGLTDEDLAGKSIDADDVRALLSEADLVIAHNASFDRPFLESFLRARKPADDGEAVPKNFWGCSLTQLPWTDKDFPLAKLEVLCIYHGFFVDAHRAGVDADALLHLLSMRDDTTEKPYLHELLQNARRKVVQVCAFDSPFETKDLLKARRYRWNPDIRCWCKVIYDDEQDVEKEWLESTIYGGRSRASFEAIPLAERFKSRDGG
jgi:DNA polymerase-3 subunit epsilon